LTPFFIGGFSMGDLTLLFGPIWFLFGVVSGLAIYRLLWYVETAVLRVDMTRQEAYNEALQKQVVNLSNQINDMQQRIRILEETNNELIQRDRARTVR